MGIGGGRTNRPGTWLGHYEILRRLEVGSRHEMLLARAHGPGGFTRIVELKRHFEVHDRVEAKRLAREARAYATLSSPWVIRLHDFLMLDGYPVLVLEHVPGPSLEDAVRRLRASGRPIPADAALYVAYAIFAALSSAHRARAPDSQELTPVIHRNLWPGSVSLAWTGDVKLGGFAMAKVLDGASEPTRPGVPLHGSHGYMAPEQVLAGEFSTATDVYSAALIVYELLARRTAFDVAALSELELLQAMAHPSLPPLASLRPYLHPLLCDTLATALAPKPEDRTTTAVGLAAVLASLLDLQTARETCVGALATIREASTDVTTPRAPHVVVPDALPSDPDATERFRFDAILPPGPARAQDSLRAAAAMTLSERPKRPSETPARRRALAGWLAAASVCLALLGGSLKAMLSTASPRPAARAPAKLAAPSTSVIRDSPFVPPVALLPGPSSPADDVAKAPAAISTTGFLLTPPRSAGHRIYVDGRVVGEGIRRFEVPCGARRVRIGSAGLERVVIVPCGASAQVP